MRVLVISAHPDDEVIGAGGAILRHVERGDEVWWCVVTQGYTPQWPQETLDRARRQVDEVRDFLGIHRVELLGFPTVRLNTVPYAELTSALQRVVDEARPEVVYTTPGGDVNLDHRIVYEATLVATRPLPGSPVRRVLCYEIGTTVRYGIRELEPNVFVDITPYLERKVQAMALYQTELREPPHPRSLEGLRIIARERGLSVGVHAAEAFHLVREVS
jgi:LmbE family N-acetylglucosaminyl deacetylase